MGPAVGTSVCGGGLDSHCETNTLKLHQKSTEPLFKVINMVSSSFKSQTSAYTCAVLLFARACRNSNKANSKPEFFFFVVVFLFWMNMPCKMFGDATTECSIFAAMAPAASICSNYRKQSGESLQLCERRAQRKFCWSYSVKVCSAAPLSRQRTDLALDFNNVRHFLRGRGRQNDILLRQTLVADGHPFTVENERATSKCNLTSCKATGHLPCIFIDWNDWGQLAVLRGNTINYTPRCGG